MNKIVKSVSISTLMMAGITMTMSANANIYCNGHRCYSERHALRHYRHQKHQIIHRGKKNAERAIKEGDPWRAARIMQRSQEKVRCIDQRKRYIRHHSY